MMIQYYTVLLALSMALTVCYAAILHAGFRSRVTG